MQSCHQLVYVSSATNPFSSEELLDVVSRSQTFNAAHDITGMLLYKDGNLIQVLEGPETEVHHLMQKISRDPRHRGIITLLERPLSERQFPDWSMGCRNLHTVPTRDLEQFEPYFSSAMRAGEPTAALKLLTHFRDSVR